MTFDIRKIGDRLFNGEHGELVRYIIVGLLNVLITWVAYAVFVTVSIAPWISNALSWIVGVAVAFLMNKVYVFQSSSTDFKTVRKEVASFFFGRILTGALALVGFPILYNAGLDFAFLGVDGFLAKVITSGLEIALNYVLSKYVVFNSDSE